MTRQPHPQNHQDEGLINGQTGFSNLAHLEEFFPLITYQAQKAAFYSGSFAQIFDHSLGFAQHVLLTTMIVDQHVALSKNSVI